MRIKKSHLLVPLLAIAGLLLALLLRPSAPPPPPSKEPPPARPAPAPAAAAPTRPAPPEGQAPARRPESRSSLSPEEISSLRSEMKIALAALFGAQQSFFAEFRRYSTDLNALGYAPEGVELKVKAGFLAPYYPENPAENEAPRMMSTEELVSGHPDVHFAPSAERVRMTELAGFCRQGCTASASGFELIAAANLDDDADLDVWVLNEKKELLQLFDDLAER